MSLLINSLSSLEKNVLWGASYFPSNVIEAVVILCQSNGMIQSGEKWAHQMPRLETHGCILKFSICELLCWHHMDILCAWSLPCDDSVGKHDTEKRQTAMPYLNLTLNMRSDPAAVSQTPLPLVTRYHREFNERLVMCGLFIDGHHWRWASPR